MPFSLEHAARMIDPSKFKEFRRKNIAKGIDAILGIMDGRSMVQSYRFDANVFPEDKAREWMQSHGLKYIAFEKATGKMQSFVRLVCQAFAKEDIGSLIDPGTLAEIMQKDQHPFFQAYSICHEGTSNPKILGETSYPIHWTRAAVQSIKATALKGIKFFLGHNADNSTDNREPLGEIVAEVQKEIDGNLNHIVVGYFPNKEKVIDKDICSQEGEWDFFEAAGNWFADKVHKITGIALSNSSEDIPAFSGAKRLGMVQAFENTETEKKGSKMSDVDLTTISFNLLKAEIQRRNTAPSELYDMAAVKGDRIFGKTFDALEIAQKTVAEKDTEIKSLKDAKISAEKSSFASTARVRYEKLMEDVKMTDKMKLFVKKGFTDTVSDLSDEGLKKLISDKVADYKNVAEVLGIKEELPAQAKAEDQANGEDMTLAKNNPLLEDDLNLNTTE